MYNKKINKGQNDNIKGSHGTDLNTVVAGGDPAVLHLHVGGGVGELALRVRPRTFLALELTTHLQLQPTTVLLVQHGVHVQHRDGGRAHVAGVVHDRGRGHGTI